MKKYILHKVYIHREFYFLYKALILSKTIVLLFRENIIAKGYEKLNEKIIIEYSNEIVMYMIKIKR